MNNDENVIPESCAELSAIREFFFYFFRPFILFSRRPDMFSSVSINLDAIQSTINVICTFHYFFFRFI